MEKEKRYLYLGLLYALGASGKDFLDDKKNWTNGINAGVDYARERELIKDNLHFDQRELTQVGFLYELLEYNMNSSRSGCNLILSQTGSTNALDKFTKKKMLGEFYKEDLINIAIEFWEGFNDSNYDRLNLENHKKNYFF